MQKAHPYKAIDIAPHIPKVESMCSTVKVQQFSANHKYALVNHLQTNQTDPPINHFLLINLETAAVEHSGPINPAENFIFSSMHDHRLFRIQVQAQHTRVDHVEIGTDSGLKLVGTIAQYASAFQSGNVDVCDLARGFLIMEKVDIGLDLMGHSGKFELVLVDSEGLLLRKNHRNYKFMNMPWRYQFKFVGDRFYYDFSCPHQSSWAMVNISTQKAHFCTLRHKRPALAQPSDKFGLYIDVKSVFELVNLSSSKRTSRGLASFDQSLWSKYMARSKIERNYFYLCLHNQICQIDPLSSCPVAVNRIIRDSGTTALDPFLISFNYNRFLGIQRQDSLERIFGQHRDFWSKVRALPDPEPPNVKIGFRSSQEKSFFCKSITAHKQSATLFVLCKVSDKHSQKLPCRDLVVEVTVTHGGVSTELTLSLGFPWTTSGSGSCFYYLLVSLCLESRALAYQVLTSNLLLRLSWVSSDNLAFSGTWPNGSNLKNARTRAQSVNAQQRPTIAENNKQKDFGRIFFVPKQPVPLTGRKVAQFSEARSHLGESV